MRPGHLRPRGRALLAAAGAVGAAAAVAVILQAPSRPARRPSPLAVSTSTTRIRAHLRRRHKEIGRSWHGRAIDAIELANGSTARRALVIACIHGNESAGIAIGLRLERMSAPEGSAIWIVPDLNPDGVAADTRQNANGVDLNRNFPWHWRPLASRGDLQYSGSRPLSEPEARAAYQLVLAVRPQITIWFHQPQDLVDLSGGDPAIEREFAKLVGLPTRRLQRYPGSAINWENTTLPGTTAFAVELPPGSLPKAAIMRYTHAVLALASPATRGRL